MNILTIGGATQDIFLHHQYADSITITQKNQVSHFTLLESGEKKELSHVYYHSGGGATNTAVSFSRMGFSTGCFCNIAHDTAGTFIQQELAAESINTSFITYEQKEKTAQSFIISNPQGDSTVFAFRGANRLLPIEQAPIHYIATCNHIYITSLSHEASQGLLHLCTMAKAHAIPVAINPGISQLAHGTQVLKDSLKYIDILILNSAEAQIFMHALINIDPCYKTTLAHASSQLAHGVNYPTSEPYLTNTPLTYANHYFSIHHFFKEIFKMGPQICVITNGCNGVYVAHKETLYFSPSINVPITSTVGCGDAFGSSFVASLLLNYSIQEALVNGIINSASVIKHISAKTGLLTHDQLKQERQNYKNHPVSTFIL